MCFRQAISGTYFLMTLFLLPSMLLLKKTSPKVYFPVAMVGCEYLFGDLGDQYSSDYSWWHRHVHGGCEKWPWPDPRSDLLGRTRIWHR